MDFKLGTTATSNNVGAYDPQGRHGDLDSKNVQQPRISTYQRYVKMKK